MEVVNFGKKEVIKKEKQEGEYLNQNNAIQILHYLFVY